MMMMNAIMHLRHEQPEAPPPPPPAAAAVATTAMLVELGVAGRQLEANSTQLSCEAGSTISDDAAAEHMLDVQQEPDQTASVVAGMES
jgi:hypothetical protein